VPRRLAATLLLLAACGTRRPSVVPSENVAARTTSGSVSLALHCQPQVSRSARRSLLDPPSLVLELINRSSTAVTVDEIQGFNVDSPDSVKHTNAANASLKLVRVGAAPGQQGYSCAEATVPPPVRRRLAPGQSYRHPLPLEPTTLAPGEYACEVSYQPLRLSGARCRFRVVP
jgi:hypothetical protein